jgi:hypothetical protein
MAVFMQHGDIGAGPLFRQRRLRQHVLAPRKTFDERCLAAVLIEDEQILIAAQPPTAAFCATMSIKVGEPLKPSPSVMPEMDGIELARRATLWLSIRTIPRQKTPLSCQSRSI